ncbi:MAG: helix-turn-helix domain-containing protein [Acidimicrobiia bacterium]|nr:helix-turn-helix domain-containing protein [Acidimicrobiia bacterium]
MPLTQETFITRLRRHRERNKISLDEICVETRIKGELLEAFERCDLSEWPRGLYARAWVRAYASAIGLDPIDTVDEFCRLFPHGDRRGGPTVQDMAAIVAHPSEYRDEFGHEVDRRRSPQMNVLQRPSWQALLAQASRHMRIWGLTQASPLLRPKGTPRTQF